MKKKLDGLTYLIDCKLLSELSELLPQLSRTGPRLLKRPRHFFSVFLKLFYNTHLPKSISFHTNQINEGQTKFEVAVCTSFWVLTMMACFCGGAFCFAISA